MADNNDKFKGLLKEFSDDSNGSNSFDEKLKQISNSINTIHSDVKDENENFTVLAEAITEIPEFEALNAKDKQMFNVFLEFWNESIYSKFIVLAESNQKDGSGALLKEIENIKSTINIYNTSNFAPYYDLNLGISNTAAYRTFLDYFNKIKNKEIPLTSAEINNFRETARKAFEILENEKNISASYKNNDIKTTTSAAKTRAKSKPNSETTIEINTDAVPSISEISNNIKEKKYNFTKKETQKDTEAASTEIKCLSEVKPDTAPKKTKIKNKTKNKLKIKANPTNSNGCIFSIIIFLVIMANYTAIHGFFAAAAVYCIFDISSSFTGNNPDELKNSFTVFSLVIGAAVGLAISETMPGMFIGTVIGGIVCSFISEPLGKEKNIINAVNTADNADKKEV